MIYSLTVMKNEEDRYLKDVMRKLVPHVNRAYVYDDLSEDDSVKIAESAGATVRVRSENSASFLENESKFRADALRHMVQDCNVQVDDWVIAVDADELIVCNVPLKTRTDLLAMSSYSLKVHEVFDLSIMDETPYVRVDGLWGRIYSDRMFKYDGDQRFSGREMGSGSVPEKFAKSALLDDVSILHYGYAAELDRVSKYARYFGRPGHNVQHVDSILRSPHLVRWDGTRL